MALDEEAQSGRASEVTGLFVPSASQSEGIELFDAFVSSDEEQVMILTGAAGTGKTEMIAEFCRRLHGNHRQPVLLAPTGQAARRLARRTGVNARTVHAQVFGNGAMKDLGDERPPQSVFPIQFEMMPPIDAVYIIDESSFISNEPMDEQARERADMVFGTTNLLADIVTHLASRKVVFVGDSNQLPPIGLDFAPALETETFRQMGLTAVAHQLSEVLRRDEHSPITDLGWRLADSIEHARVDANLEVLHQPENGLEVLTVPRVGPQEFASFGSGSAAVVARSHVGIAYWNQMIRRELGRRLDSPIPGDKMLLAKACLAPRIENGEQIEVLEIANDVETVTETIREDSGSREVSINLAHGLFRIEGDSDPDGVFAANLVLDGCYSLDSDSMSIIRRVLWIDFLKRASRMGVTRKDRKALHDIYLSDAKAQSILATYAYARTIHKSQGGEWSWVVADLSAVRGRSPLSQRMAYTAVTRAKTRLSIYFWPFAVRYIDLDEIGQEVVDQLLLSADIESVIQPVQSGRQIRSGSGDLIVNIYERAGKLGAITIQKCPATLTGSVARILRGVEVGVRARLQPLVEPLVLARAERLEASLVEQGYDFFAWRHADYQIAFVLRSNTAEAGEIHIHNASGQLVKSQKVLEGSDPVLGAVLRSAIEERWK